MRRWIFGLSAVVTTTALVMACSVGTDCDFGLCAGPTAGGDGGGTEGGADRDTSGNVDATPPGCDPAMEQKDQVACLNDEFAVFVSVLGKPDSPGTRTAPVNTVARAFELTGGNKQRIFVCEGTYGERIALKDAISIYGGLSCSNNVWNAPGGHATFKKPQDPGFALDVFNIAGSFELVDLDFVAAPGTSTTPNSIAARVVSSPGLVLKRVGLTAGVGADGDDGAPGTTGVRTPSDGKGAGGMAIGGGGPNACTCTVGGLTAGGAGGGATNGLGSAGTGDAMPVGMTDGAGGAGGSTNCIVGLGHEGASAVDQSPAAKPAKRGAIDKIEWLPGHGNDGPSGKSGQGGGGGGANNGGGGAGGCGGCGGTGGRGGAGGGASVSLLVIDSAIRVSACVLNTAQAGKGGKGGLAGTGGAAGGAGGGGTNNPNNGCAGGPGGHGGAGAHGSGGAGGIEIGILYQGTSPKQNGLQILQTGVPAAGGLPAVAGANAGLDGKQSQTADVDAL